MTRLVWDTDGQRLYENGVDQGVLYIDYIGTAWPGLISVSESPSGGEPRPYYIDGQKYLNLASAEEYEATINALSSPAEFNQCEGVLGIQNGLFATQQRRKTFGLSYRTMIGSDTDPDLGYKLHIVYHALAAPAERVNNTINQSPEPMTLSWHITSMPDPWATTTIKPTAHFVIDSRLTTPTLLADVEDMLYGTDIQAAEIPYVYDLIAMFSV